MLPAGLKMNVASLSIQCPIFDLKPRKMIQTGSDYANCIAGIFLLGLLLIIADFRVRDASMAQLFAFNFQFLISGKNLTLTSFK